MTLAITEIIRNLNKNVTVFYLFKYYKFYINVCLVLLQSIFLKILQCIRFYDICVHKLDYVNTLITFYPISISGEIEYFILAICNKQILKNNIFFWITL